MWCKLSQYILWLTLRRCKGQEGVQAAHCTGKVPGVAAEALLVVAVEGHDEHFEESLLDGGRIP